MRVRIYREYDVQEAELLAWDKDLLVIVIDDKFIELSRDDVKRITDADGNEFKGE